MAFRMSTALKEYLCTAGIVINFSGTLGTGGTGVMYVYTNTQPASADEGTAGTLAGTYGTILAVITGIGWGTALSGTCAFATSPGYSSTTHTSGTAGWARLECVNNNGTCRIDGNVGTGAVNVWTINQSVFTTAGETVTLVSADVYMA
jgi:hypothetical protein